jgi:ABC-type polysaccharide/polyol phosphate export permease
LSSIARPGAVAAAFVRRDFLMIRSYRYPFVLDSFFGVRQLAVTYFISETFPETGGVELDGAPSYFAFAAIGIVISLVIEAATQGISSRVREGQLSGSLEALLVQPLTTAQLCSGLVVFPFVFAMARAVIYMTVTVLVMQMDLSNTDWVGFVTIFLLSGAALTPLGVAAAALVLVYKRGDMLGGAVLFLMTLLSGAAFPVSVLPPLLQAIGSVVPLRFAFDGAREALFLGGGWVPEAIGLAGFAVVGIPVSLWLFERALQKARRNGSLGQY